jgi:DNA-binding NarL/FixJ family response regulator
VKDETSIYYPYFRGHDGSLQPVTLAKRNSRRVPHFPPSAIEPLLNAEPQASGDYDELRAEIMAGLTPAESRTLERRADGASILEIAKEEGVSRAAIRDRIRRMVRKNPYCEISSRYGVLKIRKNQHE